MFHFCKPLPGHSAHLTMASRQRAASLAEAVPPCATHAAVMVLLSPVNKGQSVEELLDWEVLLTRRNVYSGVHSGQVAFPGGRYEPGDRDWWETACRETYEEVGLHCEYFDPVGPLTDMYIPPSNYLVHPFLAINRGEQSLLLDAREVADYRNVPLRLFDPLTSVVMDCGDGYGNPFVAPAWCTDGYVVWGATAMILAELFFIVSGNGLAAD